jgi:hypothetical protein
MIVWLLTSSPRRHRIDDPRSGRGQAPSLHELDECRGSLLNHFQTDRPSGRPTSLAVRRFFPIRLAGSLKSPRSRLSSWNDDGMASLWNYCVSQCLRAGLGSKQFSEPRLPEGLVAPHVNGKLHIPHEGIALHPYYSNQFKSGKSPKQRFRVGVKQYETTAPNSVDFSGLYHCIRGGLLRRFPQAVGNSPETEYQLGDDLSPFCPPKTEGIRQQKSG